MKKTWLYAAAAVLLTATAVHAADDKVRIGYVNTFSGPNAAIGIEARNSFDLALEHLGGKVGGVPVEAFYEDDQMKPEVGKQVTEKLIQSNKVHFLTGYNWSNVLLASLKSAVDSNTFIISANAGPHAIAGEQCSPWFFSASWQNDQTVMATGQLMNRKGIKKVYILAPNYAAGKDMAAGLKRTYKGEVIGEEYTRWPGQLDFSAELSKVKAAKPDAVWVFYPGAAGGQFFQQFHQAGMGNIALFSTFTVDAITLPLIGDVALGAQSTQTWVQDLDNAINKRFVADYRKKHKAYPSYYGAQSYDAVLLIDSAVKGVKGNLADKEGMRATMRKADFDNTRGRWKYNTNHFPIQNFYLHEVVKDKDGALTLKMLDVVLPNHSDPHADKCPMKW